MKLFLDDVRPCPDGWILARNEREFKEAFNCGQYVKEVSFDNDLGAAEKEGWELINWLRDNIYSGVVLAPKRMYVHSMNPVARQRIQATINDIRSFVQANE